MYLYFSNHLRGPAASAGARTWHQCRNSPATVRISVVIPGIDPVSATKVEERHYAGLDFSRIEVVRLQSAPLNRDSKLSRAWYYGSLTFRQFMAGLRGPKPQAIITMSLPLSMMLIARIVSWLRRVPLVVDVRDLPFDVAREIGYAKSSAWTGVAARVEAAIIRSADLAFTVSPRFKSALEKRGCRRVVYNPIGYDNFDATGTEAQFSRAALAARFGPGTIRFLVVAAGTLGHVTEVGSLLQAAARLCDRQDIGFVLAGDGQNLERYRREVDASGANVRFLGRVSKSAIAGICRCADAAYYGSAGGYFTNAMLGNKAFDYMGAGLPVIYHGPDSAVRDVVTAADCALPSEAGDIDGLVNDIVRLADDEPLRRRLGDRARAAIHASYLAERSAAEFWRIVPQTCGPLREATA
jgi:putative colanic acid biosynthesis glycosyltransferase WcaI